MIFPVLKVEPVLQVGDRTRLDATGSFVSPDEAAITLVEIDPGDGSGFIDVTSNQFLDWQYSADATITAQLRVTTVGNATATKDISVITEANDRLFSSDADLVDHEDDILNYVRSGRNSFLDKHRLSQKKIVRWLNDNRIWDSSGNPLEKDDLTNIDEVNEWSKFYTLYVVFNSLSNTPDDVFSQKAIDYRLLAKDAQNRSVVRLDTNGDGNEDVKADTRTYRMVRR